MMSSRAVPQQSGDALGLPRPWSAPEKLLLLAMVLGVLHHADHVLRFDHSGWPFVPRVSPFTFSLLFYPIALTALYARQSPKLRLGLVAFLFVTVQAAHTFLEPPSSQYGVWARGYSREPWALLRPNLLHVHSPAMGVLSVAVAIALSLALLAALVGFVREARPR